VTQAVNEEVVAVDGQPVKSLDDLLSYVQTKKRRAHPPWRNWRRPLLAQPPSPSEPVRELCMKPFHWDYCERFFDLLEADEYETPIQDDLAKADFVGRQTQFLEQQMKIPQLDAEAIALAVFARMSSRRLHYHTPVHILTMFQFFEQLHERDKTLALAPVQELAIWFHDAIYVVGAPDSENESHSALFMEALVAPYLKDQTDLLARAKQIVEATARHLEREASPLRESDLVLDLDLCNFAFGVEGFRRTSKCIQREFLGRFSVDDYRSGRNAFLRRLLDRGFIYRSEALHRLGYEEAALKNLKSALD
jgi:predicted metal-dependent HD superfamily phosphohydrolase